MNYTHGKVDPSLAIGNSAAAARQHIWGEGEVVRLCKRAWRMGYKGFAALMVAAWDSQLSPIDLRSLTTCQRADDLHGAIFALARAKTNGPAAGSLGKRATRLLDAYTASLGFELLPDAPIFRTRGSSTTAKGGKPHQSAPCSKTSSASTVGLFVSRNSARMRHGNLPTSADPEPPRHGGRRECPCDLDEDGQYTGRLNPPSADLQPGHIATVRDVDANRRRRSGEVKKEETRTEG